MLLSLGRWLEFTRKGQLPVGHLEIWSVLPEGLEGEKEYFIRLGNSHCAKSLQESISQRIKLQTSLWGFSSIEKQKEISKPSIKWLCLGPVHYLILVSPACTSWGHWRKWHFSLCPPELELIMLRIEMRFPSHPRRLACLLQKEDSHSVTAA